MAKKRIILLVGRTGQGKSALANVLGGEENKKVKILEKEGERKLVTSKDKKLKESEGSKSETKSIQIVEFEHEWKNKQGKKEKCQYQIIDSIGIGDTTLTDSQVLFEITQGYELIKGGIHQVLFVIGGRFTPEEVTTYNLLKEFFFAEDINRYTTIVRTRFTNFEDESECGKDIKLLHAESNSNITNMINSCNGIIHVDNPSTNISGSNAKRVERQIALNKEIREASREKLLESLVNWKEDCKPKDLKKIKEGFKNKVKEEIKILEEEKKTIKTKMKKEDNLLQESKEKLEVKMKELEKKIEENKKLENIDVLETLIEETRDKGLKCQIL